MKLWSREEMWTDNSFYIHHNAVFFLIAFFKPIDEASFTALYSNCIRLLDIFV